LTPERHRIDGVNELWLQPAGVAVDPGTHLYRPAVFIECTLNFRSLRAGLNHSEDRGYTAWLPEADLAIDWDTAASDLDQGSRLMLAPQSDVGYLVGHYVAAKQEFAQYQAELVDTLSRNARLRIFYNPVFGLFSVPGDQLEEFLGVVAEAALRRVEPELKQLRRKFELQLEQIREAQSKKGRAAEGLSVDRLVSRDLQLSESETRLTSIFSHLAGTVFGTQDSQLEEYAGEKIDVELREDLDRIEDEAGQALRRLYDEYKALADEYDIFEIGLQPDNIRVNRRAILWVPVSRG
jgi:hypothetical protein